ncbi:MAG TPA: hypothetical protein VGE47_17860, partial [Burkholderiaceae bacterium]
AQDGVRLTRQRPAPTAAAAFESGGRSTSDKAMAAIFAFKCNCCGDLHEGSPSFGYRMPYQYVCLCQSADMAALVKHFNFERKRPGAMRRKVCCDDGSD